MSPVPIVTSLALHGAQPIFQLYKADTPCSLSNGAEDIGRVGRKQQGGAVVSGTGTTVETSWTNRRHDRTHP